jgi:hypothetical protein
MTYHWLCDYSNTTDVTSGTGTVYHSGAHELTSGSSGVRVTRSLVLCVCFVDRCLVLFLLSIVFSVILRSLFGTFSFVQCVFCYSSIYGFWLPLWYLHSLHSIWKLYYLYLHDLSISLRGEVRAHQPSLTPPRFIKAPVQSWKWAVMSMGAKGKSILSRSMIFRLHFENVPTVW